MMDNTPQPPLQGNNITKDISQLSVMSYNSTGWSVNKADFVSTLLLAHSVHILALQEHFQLKDNTFKISQCFPGYNTFSIPASKSNHEIHSGRPSGGIAFLYSSKISQFVTQLQVPNSSRVQGLKLTFGGSTYVLINTYFPVNTRRFAADEAALLQTLDDIKFILDSCVPGAVVVLRYE